MEERRRRNPNYDEDEARRRRRTVNAGMTDKQRAEHRAREQQREYGDNSGELGRYYSELMNKGKK